MIDFNSKVLGNQYARFNQHVDFTKEIAPCRTFVFFHELEPLFKNNLIKGGDLDNAIIVVEHPVPQEELDRLAGIFSLTCAEAREVVRIGGRVLHVFHYLVVAGSLWSHSGNSGYNATTAEKSRFNHRWQ